MCFNLNDYKINTDFYLHRTLQVHLFVITNYKPMRDTQNVKRKERQIYHYKIRQSQRAQDKKTETEKN